MRVDGSASTPPVDEQPLDLHQAALDHLWIQRGYAWQDSIPPDGIIVMESGEGCYITDSAGKTYLDFASGLWVANVGYGRTDIARAMAAQAARLHYTRSPWPTAPTVMLAARLAKLAPGTLSKVFFTSGGGEANETALKMAIQYHRLNGQPQRTKFIGRDLSYHGASFATMSVGGAHILDRSVFQPLLMPQATLIPGPGHPDKSGADASALERAINEVGPDSVAAFIGEPISSSGGIHVPAEDYWPSIREVCDRYGILLICDEVITGFGRTGKMFAVDHWSVVPDILTIAKGVTSGYAPLGAAIARSEIAERFRPGAAEAFQHVLTFGGHAVACSAALANLDIIQHERLVENAAEMGVYLKASLEELRRHPSVADVRGIGLMCCVQLAKDRFSGEPFTPDERGLLDKSLFPKLLARGVNLLGSAERIVFMPPLIVQRAEIDEAIRALDAVLTEVEKEYSWWH